MVFPTKRECVLWWVQLQTGEEDTMSHKPQIPVLLSLSVALLVATGCDDRLGLELKGVGDTANQDSGVGPSDTGGPGGSDGTTDPNDTDDTAGNGGTSTSPATYRSNNFEPEDWRDIMWRTRKNRRRGL